MQIQAPHPLSCTAPCALYALSAITGRPWTELSDEFTAAGALVNGGVYWRDIEAELNRHGFVAEEIPCGRITLGTWLKNHDFDDPAIYVIATKNHAIVLQRDLISGWGVLVLGSLRDLKHWQTDRTRVSYVYRVQS